jgi:glycerol-3-phosphate O-acyltransferase/dihydroxyacetone phosphate acyltransferase
MTWIDERLFGWSRSAKHGTSAWLGLSGDEASRIGSPAETDEEDTGDYDDVVGIIASSDDVNAKAKSRPSSYADLQRLRHNYGVSAKPQSSASVLALFSRNVDDLYPARHRKRKSLPYNITVEGIAALDGHELFRDATQVLNLEVLSQRTLKIESHIQ